MIEHQQRKHEGDCINVNGTFLQDIIHSRSMYRRRQYHSNTSCSKKVEKKAELLLQRTDGLLLLMIVVDFYATPHSCSRFAFLPILGPLLSKSVWSEISLNLPIWRKKVVKYVSIEMTQNGRENTKTRLLLVQHLKRTGK